MTQIRYALVRDPGPGAADGLTSQSGPPLQLDELRRQHAAYCGLMAELGVNLIHLDPLPGFPDAYFVEDTAVVTPELAVVARPGAHPRQGEEHSVAHALADHRELKVIQPPGTLDGGDVLIMPAGFPGTRALLETLGRPLLTLDTSQVHRMDGGLTCLSIRF